MPKVSSNDISKRFFTILLLLFWGSDHLLNYAKTVLLKLPYVYLIADYIIPFIVLLCVFFALPYMVKAITFKDILFLFCIAIAYCLNLLIHKETHDYLLEMSLSFWTVIFPVYFIGLRMDLEESLPMLYKVSMLNIWMLMLVTFLFGAPMSEERSLYQGAMGRAYNLLPHVLMVCIYAFDKANVWNISTFVVSSVYLLTCGTRGAVLCLFVFIFLFLLLQKPLRKNKLLYSVILLLMILILVCYEEILLGMKFLAGEIGMSQRTINKLLSGTFFTSNGRNVLQTKVVEGILDNPLLGYGIAGDRKLIDIYVHNIFLEMLASFGLVLGSVFIVSIVFLLVRGYRRSHTKETQKFILLLFCAVVIKLFMSSTYLQEELFFLLLGVCVKQIRAESYPLSCRDNLRRLEDRL